jgi:hypothetical protein
LFCRRQTGLSEKPKRARIGRYHALDLAQIATPSKVEQPDTRRREVAASKISTAYTTEPVSDPSTRER